MNESPETLLQEQQQRIDQSLWAMLQDSFDRVLTDNGGDDDHET
jgi:DNA polymerase IIIc chi subunit